MAAFPQYEGYKESGVEWLGEIPSHWLITKLKYVLSIRSGKSPIDQNSEGTYPVYGANGVIGYSDFTNIGTRKIIIGRVGSIGAVHIAECDSWISDNALILDLNESRVDLEFTKYVLYTCDLTQDAVKNAQPLITGGLVKNIAVALPPLPEQTRIAAFLDEKTAEIDGAIAKKQRLIELLQEQQAILISRAVTRGLDSDAPMRDSGVAWIGEIPAHWEVKRAKFLFDEVDERSETGEEELLSVSHITGVTPRSEKTVSMFMAEDYSGSKVCQRDDLVFNIMWAWMGALGVSDRTGIVSPSYGVYRQKVSGTFNAWYLERLLRSPDYVAEYNRRSTGLHSSRLRLYSHMFFNMEIGVPPREEQDRIEQITVEQARLVEQTIHAAEREIDALNEFRSILIAEAVTGKIKI